MKKFFRNYSLSITLAMLFLISWALQFYFQYQEEVNQATMHGAEFHMQEFWPSFLSATFENWQSEFLQLLTFVVLTTFLIHKGSHESRDSNERMERKIDEIFKLVKK